MNFKLIRSSFFFAVCLFGSTLAVFAQETKTTVVQRSSTYVNSSYAYKLTDQDFVNTPSWNQEDGEPPISVSRAVKIARENLPRFVAGSETWKMRLVTLQSMGEDKWYYRIHFFCFGAACRNVEDRSFTAIVKMDGTLVEPKKVTIEN